MLRRISIITTLTVLALVQCFTIASAQDLSYLINDKAAIRAFVKGFVNESGQNQIIPEDFKKSFENALLNRKSVRFEIAKGAEESDIQISGTIKGYKYLKNDPVTTYASPAGFALDALTTENYAEMTVEFIIMDTKTGKVIWQDTISTFIKKMMTPEASIPLIYDKISRTFLWKSFGKPK